MRLDPAQLGLAVTCHTLPMQGEPGLPGLPGLPGIKVNASLFLPPVVPPSVVPVRSLQPVCGRVESKTWLTYRYALCLTNYSLIILLFLPCCICPQTARLHLLQWQRHSNNCTFSAVKSKELKQTDKAEKQPIAFDRNVLEVSKKTVSLRFMNCIEVYELMISPLHPWKTLQSTSWKWHREPRCKMCQPLFVKEKRLGFQLIIQIFLNWSFIVVVKELAFFTVS